MSQSRRTHKVLSYYILKQLIKGVMKSRCAGVAVEAEGLLLLVWMCSLQPTGCPIFNSYLYLCVFLQP